jgi:hypothetical protein
MTVGFSKITLARSASGVAIDCASLPRDAMPQQLRAHESDQHDHDGACKEARLRPGMREAEAVDRRPRRLPEIEEARMQRGRRAARVCESSVT